MSTMWTPLSQRDTGSSALREGMPKILDGALRQWIELAAKYAPVQRVALRSSVVLVLDVEDDGSNEPEEELTEEWLLAYTTPRTKLLDIADSLLSLLSQDPPVPPPVAADGSNNFSVAIAHLAAARRPRLRPRLQELLDDARSVYTVSADGRALERRIDPHAAALLDQAAESANAPSRGDASRYLGTAREAAYSLHPNPVAAYSYAIKAVECAAHATVEPNRLSSTLGTMIRVLRDTPEKFTAVVPGRSGTEGVAAVLALMQLLWTGQSSRHGSQAPAVEESLEQAVVAVHIAGLLVQLFASEAVHRV